MHLVLYLKIVITMLVLLILIHYYFVHTAVLPDVLIWVQDLQY